MTLYQFNQLDEMEQAEAIWERGVHLGERYDTEHRISLYQIDGFYVEKFYHKQDEVLRRIRSFRSVDQLRPYLEQINIAKIL